MAITTINLSDNFVSHVRKINEISGNVGDVSTLLTGDSDVVSAINTLKTLFADFDDSADIVGLARSAISIINASGDGSVSYDSDTGVITYTGPSAAETRAHFVSGPGVTYDSTAGRFSVTNGVITNAMILDSSLTSSKFADRVTLNILASDGSVLKTLYSPGS